MQPLLGWKAQPLHIRLSEEITIPPLQDENADAVKGETLSQAEFRDKFPSGTSGNVTGDISWPYLYRGFGFLHLAWKTVLAASCRPSAYSVVNHQPLALIHGPLKGENIFWLIYMGFQRNIQRE